MNVSARSVVVAGTLAAFFVLVSLFFVGVPWRSELHEVPLVNTTGDHGVANALFDRYAVTLVLIALLLSSAMIGGVYLAKTEDGKEGEGR